MNENYKLHISGDAHDLEQVLSTISSLMDAIENRNLSKPMQSLAEKLQEVISLTREVQSTQSKISDKSFVSSKEMDRTIGSTKEVISQINDIKKAIREVQKQQLSDGVTPDPESINALNKLNAVLDQTRTRMRDVATTTVVGRDSSINSAIRDMERLHTLTEDYYKSVNNAVDANEKLKQVRLANNRVRRNLEKSEISGNMSYQQGVETQQAINSTRSMEADKKRYERHLEQTRKSFASDRSRHAGLADSLAQGKINRKEYEKERAQIEASIKAREKEIKTTEALISEMGKTIDYFRNSASQEFSTRTYDAKRGTFARTVQERAPSIASHATMGVAGAVSGLYMRGASLSESNRPYKVALGQQTGQSDYTGIRHNFENLSLDNKLGFNSTDMLKFASDWNSTVGYTDKGSLNNGVLEMAKGARAMGIADEEAYKSSMSALNKTGAVKSGADVRAIQSAFVAGIRESGLQGHQEEQLKALSTIAEQVGQGQTLDRSDISNISALQTMLGSSGSRGLIGDQGAQFMASLDAGIKGGMSSPYTRLAMGWGTEYQGLEGKYDLQKRLDKGISDPENVRDLYSASLSLGGTEKEQKLLFNESLKELGVNATIEQSDELFKLSQDGKLTDKSLAEFTKRMEQEGQKERDKNSSDYRNSNEGKNDQNKAGTDSKAEDVYDMAQPMRDVHKALTALPTPLYLLTAAVGALTASILASGGMMAGSAVLNRTVGKFKNKGRGVDTNGNPRPKNPNGGAGSTVATLFGLGGVIDFFDPNSEPKQKAKRPPAKTKAGRLFQGFQGLWDLDDDSLGQKIRRGVGKGVEKTAENIKGTKVEEVLNKGKGLKGNNPIETYINARTSLHGKVGDVVSNTASKAKGIFTGGSGASGGILSKIGGFFKGGGGAPNGIINQTQGFGKAMPGLGTLLSALTLGSAVASGDSGHIGGALGSIGGASMGGALGSMVMPGVGTVIGAGIGSWLGNSAGESAGGMFKGKSMADIFHDPLEKAKNIFSIGNDTPEEREKQTDFQKYGLLGMAGKSILDTFKPKDAKASELDKSVSKFNKQGEVKGETDSKRRVDAETLREKNNKTETENLQLYSNLLNRFEQLINEAKGLNFGGGNGSGTSSSNGSEGGVGSLSTLTDGKNWSSKNTVNHDLGKIAEGVTAESLDKWIDAVAPDNSKMRGMGAKYMEAGEASGLDPRYLVAHSAVETGWGTSNLSGGGNAESGNWFGIGAFDNNPNNGFNYSDGLVGGAKWIKENFYNAGQTTVDKMRNNGGTHEYATDPNWDETIGRIMAGSDKYISGAGRGGRWSSPTDTVIENPISSALYADSKMVIPQNTENKSSKVNNSNTININVSVEGGGSPEETGNIIGENIVAKLQSNLDFFSNEYRLL